MGDIIEVEEPILIDEPKIVDLKTDAPKLKCEPNRKKHRIFKESSKELEK